MNPVQIFAWLTICLFFSTANAQNSNCAHCNMVIKDNLFKAEAQTNDTTFHFDAIECLVNNLKNNEKDAFLSLKVTDYPSGKLTHAKTATYLISKDLPSPMGANLSAFSNMLDAKEMQVKKGGNIYSWKEINEKFTDSRFGASSHNHKHHKRPDAHAPIGVMGDHLHEKGGFMVSFRYMTMHMQGNKSGTKKISDAAVFNNYMVSPQEMNMQMYMLGAMYAPSNKLTLMLMQNIVKKDMDLTARMMMNGMTMMRDFSTSSSGIGDMKLGALYGIFNHHTSSLHLNSSLNFPTAEIKNSDNTPMMNNVKLPYAMQLGSGTFDITLGATYKFNSTNTSFGTQFLSTFRTGKNSENYRLGDKYQLQVWGAYKFNKNFSVSGRVVGVSEGKLKGADADLNPMMVTTADTNNYGNNKIKSYIGVNIVFPETTGLNNFRFGFEAGAPIYENYNGVQMNENLSLNFGVKFIAL